MSDEQAYEREPESRDWQSDKFDTTAQHDEDEDESERWERDKG